MAENIGPYQNGSGIDIGAYQAAADTAVPIVDEGQFTGDFMHTRLETNSGSSGNSNDLIVTYLETLTGATGTRDDLYKIWLEGLGYSGTVADMKKQLLEAAGYTGTIDDMLLQGLINDTYFQ